MDNGKINKQLSQAVNQIRAAAPATPSSSIIPPEAFEKGPGEQVSPIYKKGLRVLKEIDKLYVGYWAAQLDQNGENRLDQLCEEYGEQLWVYPLPLIMQALHNYASNESRFAPNLPTLLKELVSLRASGLPTAEQAFTEAAMHANRGEHNWSHEVVYHAAQSTGFFLLQTEPESVSRPRFEANFKVSRDKFLRGEELTKPNAVMLEDKSDVTAAVDYNSWVEKLETEHQLDVGVAAQLCGYMMRQHGSLRRTMYKQAVEQAAALGITLPSEPEHGERPSSLTAQQVASARATQSKLKRLFAVSERELARKDKDD